MRQIGFELFKLSRRPRSYLGFAAFLVIGAMMVMAARHGGLSDPAAAGVGGGALETSGSILNAEFIAWTMIGSRMASGMLGFWLPLFAALVLGDIFAGEHTDGTIRALLARPVTRLSVFWAKFTASLVYTIALVGFMVASAYALGAILFGTGGLLTFGGMGKVVWYSHSEALVRIALSCGLTATVVLAVGMLALFLSVLVGNSLGAIGGAIMLFFATMIMSVIPYFEHVKPYLIGGQIDVGQRAFMDPIPWQDIGASMLCVGGYIVLLLLGSLLVFRRKDVLA